MGLSVTGMVVYIIFAIRALSLEDDPPYAISQYISIFVIFIPLYIASAVLANSITKKKTHEKRV